MKKISVLATSALLLASLFAAGPSTAIEQSPKVPDAPADAPAYDPKVAAPKPGDLTWAEVATAQQSLGTFTEETPKNRTSKEVAAPASLSAIAGVSGQRCTIDTGNVYKRTSGSIYPYGTVGGHPKTTCNVFMISMSQTTNLYKTVWWGLQRVAGPFKSFNQGRASLIQTSPEVVCADLRESTFRMFVRSTGTFPTGAVGSASAWEGATLRCGTK